MKKIYIVLVLIFILAIVTYITINSNPLRNSEDEIRNIVLSSTPIGTSMDDVLEYIKNNKGWKIDTISYEHGFFHQGNSERNTVGKKSIRANLGDYGMIFKTNVTVF